MAGRLIPRGILPCLLIVLAFAGTAVLPPVLGDLYYPASVNVSPGSHISGDVGDLSNNDNAYIRVDEEDVGTTVTSSTATEEWVVSGSLSSGTFPGCMSSNDGTSCTYQEVDDGTGAQDKNLLLTPTGAGKYTQWSVSGAATNWDCVNDDPPHDANATYVFTNTDGEVDSYAMEDLPAMPAGYGLNGNVYLFAYGMSEGPAFNDQLANFVRTGSMDFNSSYTALKGWTAWLNVTKEHATNPSTGTDWTIAQVNAMEVGVTADTPAADTVRVTSVGAVVPLRQYSYVLDYRANVTSIPQNDKSYVLSVQGKVSDEQVDAEVWNFTSSGWDTAFSFTSSSYELKTKTLTSDHMSSGELRTRFTDNSGGDTTQSSLDIDFLWVNSTAVDYTANIDITYTQITVQANSDGQFVLAGYRTGDSEAIKLQVYRAGSWTDLGTDIFTGSKTLATYPIDVGDVVGGILQLRITDAAQTDNTETQIYVDYAELEVSAEGGQGSPVTADFETEYSWWSGRMDLMDHSISYGGQIVGWSWYVDGKYVGNAPEASVSLYPDWFDVGVHRVHVKLEAVDDMGYAAVEIKTVHVDNSLRLALMLLVFLLVTVIILIVAARVHVLERVRQRKRRKAFLTLEKESERRARNRNPRVR